MEGLLFTVLVCASVCASAGIGYAWDLKVKNIWFNRASTIFFLIPLISFGKSFFSLQPGDPALSPWTLAFCLSGLVLFFVLSVYSLMGSVHFTDRA